MRVLLAVGVLLFAAVVYLLIRVGPHIFGLDDLSGPYYGFWSGIGSDLGYFAVIGGGITLYRKHTCHVDRCWRLARHPVSGTPYIVCRRHHPAVPDRITADHVREAHRAATA